MSANASPLSLREAFAGKRVLFTGATGFLGKVTLSMLLHRYGDDLARVDVLVRKGASASAHARFFGKVVESEPFSPLRDKYGSPEGAQAWLGKKCRVLDGDITDPGLGLDEKTRQSLVGDCDVVLNCAGLVSFTPSLEVGLNVNTTGVQHVVALCESLGVPLVHISTAFVAGNRSGLVFEDEPLAGYFPKREELDGRDFSFQTELSDCAKVVARLREQAEDHQLASTFRDRAIKRLESEGRDARDEKTLRLAVGRERKLWLSTELTRAGMERAQAWGWPNTYTYTKSLGEQVIASAPKLQYAIVRPSIVESALSYPFPGWNEGFTTSAPLCFAGLKGHRGVPAGERTVLDIIPVDLVAGAVIAITGEVLTRQVRQVFHLASGDLNPFYASRSVELVGLYRRRFFRNKDSGTQVLNALKARIEPQAISKQAFALRSAPAFMKGARFLRQVLDDVAPTWGAPNLTKAIHRAQEKLGDVETQANSLTNLIELFLPFVWENRYLFRCDATRELYSRLLETDRLSVPWNPESIDWRNYFLEVHLPGLEKWVFPGLEEETQRRKAISAHRDLLELFEAAVHNFRHRVALRRAEGDREARFTYGDLDRYSARVASFLLRSGLGRQERVLLVSESRPEWSMAYFGILRAGGTAVPVDPELTERELVNIARHADAKVCVLSEDAAAHFPGLFRALAEAKLPTQVHSLAQTMEGDASQPRRVGNIRRSASPDDVASLIFTSGTTGTPKGVMLTHRNFASLVSKLVGAFDIGMGDGVLSVLPLHHTFEFSCGLLTPLSVGAEITYLDELNADRLGEVLETGRISAMVGVPALWQLLHRRLTQEIAAKPAWVRTAVNALMAAHGELRDRTPVNLGKLVFWPVHRRFGGNLKFLVSGGAALTDDVHRAFHQLGFDLAEGYGLTEAAPVLTVAEPQNRRVPGSVGRALPGIELRIVDPDPEGVGEVIAKGPSIMAGYFGDREATDAVLKDGWLYTGDLGRMDDEGRLYLAGRKKDVIIDASGKNVYPDELEALYGTHPRVKELSVVGLPDAAGGERVACLCVPDYRGEGRGDGREAVRAELEAHFRDVSSNLPFYRRIKLLRFWDGELPRTSTRKIKRKLVAEELERLERIAASAEKESAVAPGGQDSEHTWLLRVVAEVLQKPTVTFTWESRLADLGFDSLALTELGVALEQAGVSLGNAADLGQVQTLSDLRRLVATAGARGVDAAHVAPTAETTSTAEKEIEIPQAIARLGRSALSIGQRFLYGGVFHVDVSGKSFIPQNRNVLVVANHASHLDMGLVKVVMGEQGERLAALAARDYFFDTPLKRAYFENFTNLIPMDRSGSLRESLRLAGQALEKGFHLLIFPEGTRSPTGELAEFKPTLGYLALTYRVDVLPMYLEGTYDALPRGAVFPKHTKLAVRIGPSLSYDVLRARTETLSKSEGYRHVTRLAETAVRALAKGDVIDVLAPSRVQTISPGTSRTQGQTS
ncbi:MAG: AMP-binding protein [Myxococcaceae bacterium]